jgi:tRNA(fMet)-specific endonuclease VapC
MVVKRIILDTNAYTHFLTGDNTVLEAMGVAEEVYMSVIVLGELFTGFRGGSREGENRKILGRFLDKPTVNVIDITVETVEIFGELKYTLKQAGIPIPINDVWLAAQAVETGSVIISFDIHFLKIPGIRIWDNLT